MSKSCHTYVCSLNVDSAKSSTTALQTRSEPHMTQSRDTWVSHLTHEWVVSHIWIHHVAYMCAAESRTHQKARWLPRKRDPLAITPSCGGTVQVGWPHTTTGACIWMSNMKESCHTFEWVMSHIRVSQGLMTSYNDWCVYMNEQYEWVMSHIWVSHVTHTSESRLDDLIQRPVRVYEWAIWMSHVAHLCESCHTYEWVMSHIWMSHVTHMNDLCYIYEWVQAWWPHTTTGACMSLSNMNESCHTCKCVVSHIWMSHVTYMSYEWVKDGWLHTPTGACIWTRHLDESCHTYEWFMSHIW